MPAATTLRGSVLCIGLCCLDQQLLSATELDSREAIGGFAGCEMRAGGSTSNTAAALRALGADAALVTLIGHDLHGDELLRQWRAAGVDTSLVRREQGVSTALAVLPVFEGGGRACWVDLQANAELSLPLVLDAIRSTAGARIRQSARALHIGYPHLLPQLQGASLATLLWEASDAIDAQIITSIDLNGVSADSHYPTVLEAALPGTDLLHANLDEVCVARFQLLLPLLTPLLAQP